LYDVAIIGGGLAGLTSSILLNRNGLRVLLIEKKKYPFHKVCGEYISNEVMPFFKRENLLPSGIEIAEMKSFLLSSINGKKAEIQLNLGGFGISRYNLDNHLYQIAKSEGVTFKIGESVDKIIFNDKNDVFTLSDTDGNNDEAKIVIASYGKRSKLDKKLNRSFIEKRSPYVGVKYHIKYDHAHDQVALHNFEGGYCGLNRVENGISNLCYLTHRRNLKNHGSVPEMEKAVLSKNPILKDVFENADFLFEKPEVINEISFETKNPVENHLLMCGDSAGMITPLCGNGMAMAIHSAKILSECIVEEFKKEKFERSKLESSFTKAWKKQFATRLAVGRRLQNLFGGGFLSGFSVNLIKWNRPLAKFLIEQTHGKPF